MNFEFKKGDCLIEIKKLQDESINCILTDPPYKYLKNQKLEVDFDEHLFFTHAKRILKSDGFIVLFGRGSSFYRWNNILNELGFLFKEEVIWDKSYTTSPAMAMSRVHETISIHTKKLGSIKKVKVPYVQMKSNDIEGIIRDIKRLKTTFNNTNSLNDILNFLQNTYTPTTIRKDKFKVTARSELKEYNRSVAVLKAIRNGMNEKSIIKEIRDHYTAIHPTQKPVRLLERLLALTTKENDVVLDSFAGSCSTGIACLNMNRNFIGYEIDDEYYSLSINRINNIHKKNIV